MVHDNEAQCLLAFRLLDKVGQRSFNSAGSQVHPQNGDRARARLTETSTSRRLLSLIKLKQGEST